MMNVGSFLLLVSALPWGVCGSSSLLSGPFGGSAKENGEEARWLMSQANWGTLSFPAPSHEEDGSLVPYGAIVPFATDDDTDGRVYFYLMGTPHEMADSSVVSLTVSEASLIPSQFAGASCTKHGSADPEDPRCAKLTLSGLLMKCQDANDGCQDEQGKTALFARHPDMAHWPVSHHFTVYTLEIQDLFMISTYGGGAKFDVNDYHNNAPKHHPAPFHLRHYNNNEPQNHDHHHDHHHHGISMIDQHYHPIVVDKPNFYPPFYHHNVEKDDAPDWDKKVERARWIVHKSLWATVATLSQHLSTQETTAAFGNVRSVVDGLALFDSTGKPVFYLPSPDPTSVDVKANPHISLVFSEAALADRLSDDGKICGGKDAGDPTCAFVVLTGTAVQVDNSKTAQAQFKVRHPLAPWLSKGGAHTGGAYYTIDIQDILILDYYGGPTSIKVEEYLAWTAPEEEELEN